MQRNIYAEETIQELYAYTDCEVQVNSNLCVICENVPTLMTVSEVLRRNTEKLLSYHRQELAIALHTLEEKHQEKTLAQIFIETASTNASSNAKPWKKSNRKSTKG